MQQKRKETPLGKRDNTPASVMWPRIAVVMSVFLLVTIGLVMVYSASAVVNIDAEVEAHADALKQLLYAGVGVGFCALIAFVVPYRAWRGWLTWAVLAFSVLLLVLTAAIGTVGLGAQRWLTLGGISLQPSEIAKIGVILAVAKLVADYREGSMDSRTFLIAFGIMNLLIVALILVAQSDLGTTVICFVGMITILWLAEVPKRFIGIYSAVIGALGALALTTGYRFERLMSFTHPWDDYYGSGYQVIHSMYAFAQGGIFGTGLGNSAEKYLYLPEASTDFIFSIIGEEMGLIGALFVVGLFLAFLLGGLRMAQEAPDSFGMVLCGACSVIIVFQAFLNIGCVIGVMPITGKPLPFVSEGGSSLIASLVMVGIMLSVSRASGESPVYDERRARIRPVRLDEPRGEYRAVPRSGARGVAPAGYLAGRRSQGASARRGAQGASYRPQAVGRAYRYSRGGGR